MYKVLPTSTIELDLANSKTLTPDESHILLSNSTQIHVMNLETGTIIPILEIHSPFWQSCTITKDGYLYYCSSRDERNIWLSEIEDVPMKISDH